MLHRRGLLVAAWLLLAAPLGAASLPSGVPAQPAEPVTDLVGSISPGAQQQLNALLRQRWREGRGQVGVLILPSLEGRPIEDVGIAVARSWGLGGAESDDGVLLLIAPNEREIGIEVGQKNEAWLTDIASSWIIDERMAPRLRKGDFDGAVQAGVAGILEALEGKAAEPTAPMARHDPFEIPWGKVALFAAFFLLWTLFQIPSAKAAAHPLGLHRNPWFWGFLLFYSLFKLLIQALSRGGGRGGWSGGGGGGYGGGGGGYSGGGASGRW